MLGINPFLVMSFTHIFSRLVGLFVLSVVRTFALNSLCVACIFQRCRIVSYSL